VVSSSRALDDERRGLPGDDQRPAGRRVAVEVDGMSMPSARSASAAAASSSGVRSVHAWHCRRRRSVIASVTRVDE
jgi:hypothetical protein